LREKVSYRKLLAIGQGNEFDNGVASGLDYVLGLLKELGEK
jgi:hypothetical protein